MHSASNSINIYSLIHSSTHPISFINSKILLVWINPKPSTLTLIRKGINVSHCTVRQDQPLPLSTYSMYWQSSSPKTLAKATPMLVGRIGSTPLSLFREGFADNHYPMPEWHHISCQLLCNTWQIPDFKLRWSTFQRLLPLPVYPSMYWSANAWIIHSRWVKYDP